MHATLVSATTPSYALQQIALKGALDLVLLPRRLGHIDCRQHNLLGHCYKARGEEAMESTLLKQASSALNYRECGALDLKVLDHPVCLCNLPKSLCGGGHSESSARASWGHLF